MLNRRAALCFAGLLATAGLAAGCNPRVKYSEWCNETLSAYCSRCMPGAVPDCLSAQLPACIGGRDPNSRTQRTRTEMSACTAALRTGDCVQMNTTLPAACRGQ
jgi:hypothetical protein